MATQSNGRKTTLAEELGVAAAKAATPIARKLQAGFNIEVVDDLTYKIRIGICEGCQFFRDDRSCGKCLCPMDYKASLKHNPYLAGVNSKLVEVKCPEGLW